MIELARDIMNKNFHTLRADMTIAEAVKVFTAASAAEDRKMFGMMVTDEDSKIIGMLSMYDILVFINPKHVHIWGMMEDLDISGMIAASCEQARSILVADIMTTEVVSVTPDTHLLMVLDIMLKKHVRRLPVLEDDRVKGIIYISDLFYHILSRMG
jgi:CBS domain-containing protein